jgi:predicted DNA-binding protein (MmcQ/YjbR family)
MNLEQLRAYCLSLKGTTEDVKWGHDLCFSIGGKMYCVTGFEGPVTFSLKADDDEFEALCALPAIIPAPYLARHKWVYIQEDHTLDDKKLKELIAKSYELVKAKLPAKLRKELE